MSVVEQPQRIMPADSIEAQISMVRQLNARVHIDNNSRVIETLRPHLNQIITLSKDEGPERAEVPGAPAKKKILHLNEL
jgi:hypothetical protein